MAEEDTCDDSMAEQDSYDDIIVEQKQSSFFGKYHWVGNSKEC